MKVIIVAWLTINGQVVSGSIMSAPYPSMEACEEKGREIKTILDGKRSVTTADYICLIDGVPI